MTTYDLSIIIPAHNAEAYIYDCLSSIYNIRQKNTSISIQIITINDGSSDNTESEILRFSTETDSSILCVRTDNCGPSGARNIGINLAKGRYIGFLDADDCWLPGMNHILANINNLDCDILEFDAIRDTQIPPRSQAKTIYKNYFKRVTKSGNAKKEAFIHGQWFVWSRFFHSRLLKDIKFEEGRRYEDINFTARCYIKADTILSIDETCVGYRINPTSITANVRINDVLDVWHAIEQQKTIATNYKNLCAKEWLEYLKANTWLTGQALIYSGGRKCNVGLEEYNIIRREIIAANQFRRLGMAKFIRIKFERFYGFTKALQHQFRSITHKLKNKPILGQK